MTKVLMIVLLAIFIIIGGPLATIWSLNTLFPVLNIDYTLSTWIAAFWLFAAVAYKGTK